MKETEKSNLGVWGEILFALLFFHQQLDISLWWIAGYGLARIFLLGITAAFWKLVAYQLEEKFRSIVREAEDESEQD